MAINSTVSRILYLGDGTTTAFSFPYAYQTQTDLRVKTRTGTGAGLVEVDKTLTSHYTVAPTVDATTGGIVTFLTAPDSTTTVVLFRDPPQTQTLDLQNNGPMPAESVEKAFDKQVMIVQRLQEQLSRAVLLKETDTTLTMELPFLADRTSSFLGFDASGRMAAFTPASFTPSTITVTPYIQGLLVAATQAAAQSTLGVDVLFPAYSSVGASYTVTSTDTFIDVTASGGTITMPTGSSSIVGRPFCIRDTVSGFSTVTVIYGSSTTTLNRANEAVSPVYDGATWKITDRYVPASWTACTITLTGASSNPNLGSTGTVTAMCRPVSDALEVMFDVQSGGSGITAGSGNYLIGLPSGLTINSTKLPNPSGNAFQNVLGNGNLNQSGVTFEGLSVCYNNTTTVLVYQTSGAGQGTSVADNSPNTNWITTAGNGFSGRFSVPIQGWNG